MSEMSSLQATLNTLKSKLGTDYAAWYEFLQKTASSKNISVEEWNAFLFRAAVSSADLNKVVEAVENVIANIGLGAIDPIADANGTSHTSDNVIQALNALTTALNVLKTYTDHGLGTLAEDVEALEEKYDASTESLTNSVNSLDSKITDGLSTVGTNLTNGLSTLDSKITSEINSRESADSSHESRLNDFNNRLTALDKSTSEGFEAVEDKIDEEVASLNRTLESKVTKDSNGNVIITGNLTVGGETTVVDTNTLQVDAPIAVVNTSYLEGESPEWANGGIVVLLSDKDAFGIVYNRRLKKVIASVGTYENGKFTVQNPIDFIPLWNGESTEEAIPMFEGGKLKPSGLTKTSIEKIAADAKCKEWDHVITTEEAFTNISKCTGTVLVKGLHMDFGDWYDEIADIVINATYVKFIDCSFAATYGAVIVGNKNCTLDGFYWLDGPDTIDVQNFGKVINCKQDKSGDISGYPLHLIDCDYVHNTDFGKADNCSHISDCILTMAYGPVLNGCSHIHGLRIELQKNQEIGGECIFHACEYLSNISLGEGVVLNILYHNCLFVDPDTCAGFLPSLTEGELNDEVQILTRDGSFKSVHLGDAVAAYVNGTILTGEW